MDNVNKENSTVKDRQIKKETNVVRSKYSNKNDSHWTKFHSVYIYIFAVILTISNQIFLFCAVFLQIPPDNKEFAHIVIGFILGTSMSSIMTYFFGSRTGDSKEDTGTNSIQKDHRDDITIGGV